MEKFPSPQPSPPSSPSSPAPGYSTPAPEYSTPAHGVEGIVPSTVDRLKAFWSDMFSGRNAPSSTDGVGRHSDRMPSLLTKIAALVALGGIGISIGVIIVKYLNKEEPKVQDNLEVEKDSSINTSKQDKEDKKVEEEQDCADLTQSYMIHLLATTDNMAFERSNPVTKADVLRDLRIRMVCDEVKVSYVKEICDELPDRCFLGRQYTLFFESAADLEQQFISGAFQCITDYDC